MELYKIYKKLRRWEIDAWAIKDTEKEIAALRSGKKEPEKSIYDLRSLDGHEVTIGEEIESQEKGLNQLKDELELIGNQLKAVGVDPKETISKANEYSVFD